MTSLINLYYHLCICYPKFIILYVQSTEIFNFTEVMNLLFTVEFYYPGQ
jgi:hypothetical protein